MRSFPVIAMLVVLVAPAALGATASADAGARQRAGRLLFDTQVRLLNDKKLDAFANQFVDGDRAAAMFPSSRTPAVGRRDIRAAAETWAGAGRTVVGVTVTGTPTAGVKSDDDTGKRTDRLVVVTGDLEVTVRGKSGALALRMTSVLAAGFDRANVNALAVVAVIVTEPTDDKALRTEDITTENKDFDRFFDLLRFPDVLAAHFDAAPDDIVIGSAAGDRGKGAEATKLLGRWKDLTFVVVGKPKVVKTKEWMYILGNVAMTRGTQKPAVLETLLVGYPDCASTCVGTELTPHVVALHYGQSRN
ncbi:MAG: hypothetical protein ABI867_43700 [Kofleriaceae bacterium]